MVSLDSSLSSTSIWPMQFTINELPPWFRKKNFVLDSLWFSSRKPNVDVFSRHVVQELKSLSETGFTWILQGKGVRSTVDLLLISVDSC